MGLALEVVGDENGAVEAVAIAELEMQFASLLGAERDDAEFLKSFAQGSGERRFIRIDFPPGPLILPAPKPRFCG
ncbi:MAG TPA: hypothetical protein VH207_08125 [Chthoniobacterales bacterium]|nr:hypothetical protein [Chthoniobacterales bacterium]